MKFRVGTKAGDTLIEVMFAIGIFSLVAITIVSVMIAGSSNVQTSLETTMARNEIDAQAEALRFIHQGYITEVESDVENGPFTELWNEIRQIAGFVNSAGNVVGNVGKIDQHRSMTVFQPTTCSDIYKNTNDDQTIYQQSGFVIDARAIGTGSQVIYKAEPNGIFNEASIYPRLLYNTSTNSLLDNTNSTSTLQRVEGIYIFGLLDPGGTSVVNREGNPDDTSVNNVDRTESAFYDFYIRTCWYGSGKQTPSTISTLIRLYDPDVKIEDYAVMDYVLSFDKNGNDVTGTYPEPISASGQMVKRSKTGSAEFELPATYGNLRKGTKQPLGWSESGQCNDTNLAAVAGGKVTLYNSAPMKTLKAVWECGYSVVYDMNLGSHSVNGLTWPNTGSSTGYVRDSVNKKLLFNTSAYGTSYQIHTPAAPSYADGGTAYDFKGWCESKIPFGATTNPGGVSCISANGTGAWLTTSSPTKTYYAWWAEKPAAVSYNLALKYDFNGGSKINTSIDSPKNCTSTGTSSTMNCMVENGSNLKKDNATFLGWSTNSSAKTVNVLPGNQYTVSTDAAHPNKTVTLYAVWQKSFNSGTPASDCTQVKLFLRWVSGDLDGVLIAVKPGAIRLIIDPNGIVVSNHPDTPGAPYFVQSSGDDPIIDTSNGMKYGLICHNGSCNNTTGQGAHWENAGVVGETMTVPICKGWEYNYHVVNNDHNSSVSRGKVGLMFNYVYNGEDQWVTVTPGGVYSPSYYYTNHWMPFNTTAEGIRRMEQFDTRCYTPDCDRYRFYEWYKGGYGY